MANVGVSPETVTLLSVLHTRWNYIVGIVTVLLIRGVERC
jgi:hypothetical protein